MLRVTYCMTVMFSADQLLQAYCIGQLQVWVVLRHATWGYCMVPAWLASPLVLTVSKPVFKSRYC
jgi:hypothetical protein